MYQSKGEATFSAFPINPDIMMQRNMTRKVAVFEKQYLIRIYKVLLNRQFKERGFLIDHFKVIKATVNEIS
jgi:hypothetical protein